MKIILLIAILFIANTSVNASDLYLLGEDNQRMGCISCNEYGGDSIWNEYSTFGNEYNGDSIWNDYGTYGNDYNSSSHGMSMEVV